MFAHQNPKFIRSAAPPILIAGLRIAGEKQPDSELGSLEVNGLTLKNSQSNLQIDCFSVGQASSERIRFHQYELEGADVDWTKPTSERSVS